MGAVLLYLYVRIVLNMADNQRPEGIYGVSDETLEVLNYAVRYRSRRALEIWADIQKYREDSLEIDKSDVPFA